MQKISQKSQNLSKISGFEKNFKIEITHHIDKRKIDISRLILKIEDSNFTCMPNLNSRITSNVERPTRFNKIFVSAFAQLGFKKSQKKILGS